MTDRYLTLREAEDFTGKSRSTLRRFLEGITKNDDSTDRGFLLPTTTEVAKLKKQNQPFSWRISEELLRREFPKEEARKEPANQSQAEPDRLIAVLEKSISMLEKELNEKNTQISQLHERQREHNVLLRDLQERLALNAPKKTEIVESEGNIAKSTEPSPDRKKKSIWTRPISDVLFRRKGE